MLRKASVLVGRAVALSLLLPVRAWLQAGGIQAPVLPLPALDLATWCVLAALLPALLLFGDGQLAHRIPRRSGWVLALAFFSLLFILLHVQGSLALATAYAGEAVAAAGLPPVVTPLRIVEGLEIAARLGVLVSLVGVLLRLDAAPEAAVSVPAPARRRKK